MVDGRSALLPKRGSVRSAMAVTQKISVAMGRSELRLAKTAAEEEGVSLSAYVTRAVRDRLEERQRLEAAREILATFDEGELATPTEQRELLALWANEAPSKRRVRTTRRRVPSKREA
jgi:hypothetical protein